MLGASHTQVRGAAGETVAAALTKGCDESLLARTIEWLDAPDHFILTLDAEDYPELLVKSGYPPPLLYGIGKRALSSTRKLAIVGSRNPSAQGERNAEAFAEALSSAGLTIVSGLAMGIDACAHRGALRGGAATIAVVGTGLDRVYPARNRDLAKQISVEGLLLSEFPLGTAPLPGNFPRRNRIISGLSSGCLVVEAALSSGSLITARFAAEQGREVFAIPGSIHSPLAKGGHALIKQGAKLVETANDVLEELQWVGARDIASTPDGTDSAVRTDEDPVMRALGYDAVDLDSLCERTGLSVGSISTQLLQWELDGRIVVLPGNLYQRVF